MRQDRTQGRLRTILVWTVAAGMVAGCAVTAQVQAESAKGSRGVLIILPREGFDELQYTIAWARLRANGIPFSLASSPGGVARGQLGMEVALDLPVSRVNPEDYRGLLLLSGPGVQSLIEDASVQGLVEQWGEEGRPVAALEGAPAVLAQAGLLTGRQAVCWPTWRGQVRQFGAEIMPGITARAGFILTGLGGSDENTTAFMREFITMIQDGAGDQVENLPFMMDGDGRRFVMSHGGRTRAGLVVFPPGLGPDSGGALGGTGQAGEYSLVLGLHGMAGTGKDFREKGFDVPARELGFLMVYPDGYNGDWDVIPGRPTLFDDEGFFRRLITVFLEEYPVDPRRVYVTGHSLGAFMSYRLAQDLSAMIAAAAPGAGLMYPSRKPEKPVHPVSILHIHARDDWNVPFDGDPLYDSPVSVAECMEFWRGVNGVLWDGEAAEGEEFFSWRGVRGIRWPGADGVTETALVEHPTGGHGWLPFATEQIASFFYHHPPRPNNVEISYQNLPSYGETGRSMTIAATVRDPEGIGQIVFLKNGEVLGRDDSPPYTVDWMESVPGTYRITARAELKDGGIVASTDNRSICITPPRLDPLASRGTVMTVRSSSNESPALKPENLLDGDPYTRWASEYSDDQWLEIDLGAVRGVSGLTLVWEAAHARAYGIEISSDGGDWTELYRTEDCPGGTETLTWPAQEARYIRLRGHGRATAYGYSLWDVVVHGE